MMRRSRATTSAALLLMCLAAPAAQTLAEDPAAAEWNPPDNPVSPAPPLLRVQADEADVLGARPTGDEAAQTRELLQQLMADDAVVARVNGKEIRWGDVWRSAEDLPEDYQNRLDTLFPALLQRTIDLTLLADAARRQGLQNDAAIQAQVKDYEEGLIRERFLQQQIEDGVSADALRDLYVGYLTEQAETVEVSARHIQLPDREAALEVIAALDDGADFAVLARQRSTGSSAARGGDLGVFRLNRMAPAFADAVARLAPGSYTREPVETEFGWHVILLISRQGGALKSFAELEPQLRADASRRAVKDLLHDLREQAIIRILPAESEASQDPPAPDAAE